MQTFIVGRIENALSVVSKFTLYAFASERFGQPRSFGFVDLWVVCCLALSIFLYGLSFVIFNTTFQIGVVILFVFRLWEYVPYILTVTIFTKPKKGGADILDAKRSVTLLLFNYLEMIFWFATCYSILSSHNLLKIAGRPRSVATFRESVMSMVANASGSVTDMSQCALAVMTFQNVFGLLMTILVTARIISFLPAPKIVEPGS